MTVPLVEKDNLANLYKNSGYNSKQRSRKSTLSLLEYPSPTSSISLNTSHYRYLLKFDKSNVYWVAHQSHRINQSTQKVVYKAP